MSDVNVLMPRREPELSEQDEAGIVAAAIDLASWHWVEQVNRLLRLAVAENHRLTLRLEEREETIAALLAKPRLRVVREDDWMGRRFDSETAK